MFKCDGCGECCRHLDRSELYAELDRGDGVCKFLNGNLCTIYKDRPILCNIDKSYELYFSKVYDKEIYYQINYEACKKLKKEMK